jgi:hypothetical protein
LLLAAAVLVALMQLVEQAAAVLVDILLVGLIFQIL